MDFVMTKMKNFSGFVYNTYPEDRDVFLQNFSKANIHHVVSIENDNL